MTTQPSSLPPVFLDTAFVFALVNTRDQWHEAAALRQARLEGERRRLVTTELVLVEIADGLASVRFRAQAFRAVSLLNTNPLVEVVPFTSKLMTEALALYGQRPDKDWGLTDCASFVVMRERGLTDVLTVDEHFRQAGFRALLIDV